MPLNPTILGVFVRIVGFNGKKMSKSLDNHLAPHHEYQGLVTRTRKMITDPQKIRIDDLGRPEICSVYAIRLCRKSQ